MLNKKICYQCCKRHVQKWRYSIPFVFQAFKNDFNDSWQNGVFYCHLNKRYIALEDDMDFQCAPNQKLIEKCPYFLEHTINA